MKGLLVSEAEMVITSQCVEHSVNSKRYTVLCIITIIAMAILHSTSDKQCLLHKLLLSDYGYHYFVLDYNGM